MERRQLLGILGTAGATTLYPASGAMANGIDGKQAFAPPRLSTEDLVRRIAEKGFDPNSLYAHELILRGIVEIKREVPLLRIKGVNGPQLSRAHLYGAGGNYDVGSELQITALIVGHGFGALMLWSRQCSYVSSEPAKSSESPRK